MQSTQFLPEGVDPNFGLWCGVRCLDLATQNKKMKVDLCENTSRLLKRYSKSEKSTYCDEWDEEEEEEEELGFGASVV